MIIGWQARPLRCVNRLLGINWFGIKSSPECWRLLKESIECDRGGAEGATRVVCAGDDVGTVKITGTTEWIV